MPNEVNLICERPIMTSLTRRSIRRPGYDYMFCEESLRDPDKGMNSDEWFYWVTDDQTSLVLHVFTDIFPPTVPKEHVDKFKAPNDLFPLSFMDAHWLVPDLESKSCTFLPGPCGLSSLFGIDCDKYGVTCHTLQKYGDPNNFEQPESFWVRMEEIFRERFSKKTEEDGEDVERGEAAEPDP